MKISHMLAAAGLAIAALGVSAGADAQPRRDNGPRHEVRHDNGRHHASNNRHGYNKHRKHCRTEWRNHRRVRICR